MMGKILRLDGTFDAVKEDLLFCEGGLLKTASFSFLNYPGSENQIKKENSQLPVIWHTISATSFCFLLMKAFRSCIG
jgi:hypothetical protein